MDNRERYEDTEELLRAALDGLQSKLWTALPGIVEAFDPVKKTAVVQPALKARVRQPDGSSVAVALPLLLDCPVHFPEGGGYALTFPVQPGDECLVVFASRCLDAWWQSGGIQEQAELRMHDLSDGCVFVGFSSVPRVFSNIRTDAVVLRDLGAGTFLALKSGTITLTSPDKVVVMCDQAEVTATTSVLVSSPLTTFVGNVVVQGTLVVQGLFSFLAGLLGVGGMGGSTITGDITHTSGNLSSNGKILHTHTHNDPQGGTTGGPN